MKGTGTSDRVSGCPGNLPGIPGHYPPFSRRR